MAQIISQRERQYSEITELNFYDKKTGEVCWGFPWKNGKIIPCDANGEPCSEAECTWWQNYLKVKDDDRYYSEVTKHTWTYVEPAHAICECGQEILLVHDAQECWNCGRLHNMFGQELLPREQWDPDEMNDEEWW